MKKMEASAGFFIILLSTCSLFLNIISAAISSSPCSFDFPLDHHPHLHRRNKVSGAFVLTLNHAHGPCSPINVSSSAATILLHDVYRVNHLTSRLRRASTSNSHHRLSNHHNTVLDTSSSTFRVPLKSGASLGVGNYVTQIGLGTPSKDYTMVVDTGSSLTWLQCKPCTVSCYAQIGEVFDPNGSTTYKSTKCSEPECTGLQKATLNPSACSKRNNNCIYEASYGDSSFSVGYLGKDTLSIQKKTVMSEFVYGCGQDNEGLFGKASGLIGLAKNKLSMLGQISKTCGNSFSYCLPTKSSSGYLSLGDSAASSKYTFTPMATNSRDDSLYFIKLVGITVAHKSVSITASTYSSASTIMDSGTVITRLPSSIFSALNDAVLASLSKYPRAPAYSILETCFKGSYKSLPVPPVSLIFAGNAEMKLSPQNIFYDLTSKGMTCLAFAKSASVGIIGNQQQQTFSVAYDVGRSRIGFAAGGCS